MAGAGKKTFTAGAVLTATDVNTYLMDQAVMVFSNTAARSSAIPTPSEGMVSYRSDDNAVEMYDGSSWTNLATPFQNNQTGTTYTFVLTDSGKLVTANNASSQTFTIPPQSSVTWPTNTVLNVVNYGTGTVTFAGGTGVTVTNTASTLSQYGAASLIRTGSDSWTIIPLSGGAAPLSDSSVTGTTGTPTTATYTESGINYKSYTFTGSGSITFNRAGTIDILVVGGGGSGGQYAVEKDGGGGAGQYLILNGAYITAATCNVTVGAGASGGYGLSRAGTIGLASGISIGAAYVYNAIGGGAGNGYGNGQPGGSGGGGNVIGSAGGASLLSYGNAGGASTANTNAGGGGGAGAAGSNGSGTTGGNGGNGLSNTLATGSSQTYAGGGGGNGSGANGTGGSGGGGNGGSNGTANTGGGGGGFASGGSGIVIIRVRA